jgi:hypothetical protein
MKTSGSPVIDLRARFAAATAKAEKMIDAAPRAGVDLDDLERARRRLADHEREYDRTSEPSKRRALARLMDAEIGRLASAYKQLAAVLDRL